MAANGEKPMAIDTSVTRKGVSDRPSLKGLSTGSIGKSPWLRFHSAVAACSATTPKPWESVPENEPTLFWLTNHVRRIFATDIYLNPDSWTESADVSMLVDPAVHWPFEWQPRRLVAQHMDGRGLRYGDESFDAIFSSSSLEHFGDRQDVERSI